MTSEKRKTSQIISGAERKIRRYIVPYAARIRSQKEKIPQKKGKSGEKRPKLAVKSASFFIKSGYKRKNMVYLSKIVERI